MKPPEKKKKGPVELGKEEEDKLETFALPAPTFVSAELRARFAINFILANVISAASSPYVSNFVNNASPVVASVTDYSVISSVNFTIPPPCIEPNA